MMRSFGFTATILALGLTTTVVPAIGQVDARIWLENEPDYFRRGDRMDVSFVVSDDAYVAVVHVDTDGTLDFVYPASPWDNEFVRGGRILSLPARGGGSWMVRSRPGIGYFYLIASPEPLDFSYFRGRLNSPWDWGYAGRAVHGDPFIAFDQIARLIMPRWPYAPYAYDYYSYYVEGLHRYPTYACSDRYYDYGWGWTPSYGSCGSLDYFLRDHPYYYDTRRYRGDRRIYLRDYDYLDPRHGFKEEPDRPARGITPRGTATPRGTSSPPRDVGAIPRREPVGSGGNDGGAGFGSQPPRRDTGGSTGTRAPAEPRDRPTPDTGARRAPDTGATAAPADRRPARGRP